jgi:DNA-binding GntR family transcriptional regulator
MAQRPRFEAVHRESTAALIADQLRKAIMDGTLGPGAQLSETELANEFKVSRGPLREAMQRLVQEGLLRSERNRGIFVRVLTADDIEDIYLARLAVESAAITTIIAAADESAPVALRAACEELTEAVGAGDLVRMSDADLRLHETLVLQSGSPRLKRMQQTLLVETRMCMTALQDTSTAVDVVGEHRAIVDAIVAADEELAHRLLAAHMQDALRRLSPSAREADRAEIS